MFVWNIFVFTQYIYYRDLFFRGQHRVFMNAIVTGECAILIPQKLQFKVCVRLFSFYSIQLLSWLIFFGARIASLYRHLHMWVRYNDTMKITVWCMSLLLLSIDLWWLYYFIMFYFKLTNGEMVKWWMVKWCNGEIKIRIGPSISHKYWICSFVVAEAGGGSSSGWRRRRQQ